MISVNYQMFGTGGFQLRLRIYQDGETRFVNVTKLLKGSLTKRHWNKKKKCFFASAPFSELNNETLVKFIAPYEERAKTWSGTLAGFMLSFEKVSSVKPDDDRTFVHILDMIVSDMKANNVHADGTLCGGYEHYEKLKKRMEEFCESAHVDHQKLSIDDMTPEFVNKVLLWAKNRSVGKCLYISKTLRAALSRASKMGKFDFSTVEGCNWEKGKTGRTHKYETLSDKLCKSFSEIPDDELPQSGRMASLYRDFCIFILYSCQSACDAISLKYSNIQVIDGIDHFVFKRRKIDTRQPTDCLVPINDEMKRIMKKWKPLTKDGYVFPIRSKERINNNKVNNGDIKHFLNRLNYWLKLMTDKINCPFPLHTYVFRHTGITRYVSKGVPIIYVANLAGTSVSNCEKIYYNNQGDTTSRDKVLSAVKF